MPSFRFPPLDVPSLVRLLTLLIGLSAAPSALAACMFVETTTRVCTLFGSTWHCETTTHHDMHCFGGGPGDYDPGDYSGPGGGGGGSDPGLPPSGNHLDVDGDNEMDCFLNLVESTKVTQNPLPDWANLGGKYGGPSDGRRWPHNGIDVAGNRGDRVRAAQAGTVSEIVTGQFNTQQNPSSNVNGNFVRVNHTDGTQGAYIHLHTVDSTISVGTTVHVGQTLGTVNNTGASDGDHLHYTNWIIQGQTAENPEINNGDCP
jgi:murein DD-endopeptidase MepM/ murein hydrolase activator NlpD